MAGKYMLLQWGTGEGCDYTIGCNEKITPLDSVIRGEAVKEAVSHIFQEDPLDMNLSAYEPDSPYYLQRAAIVEICEELPIEELYQECRDKIIRARDDEKEKEELAELERLKRKYGQ